MLAVTEDPRIAGYAERKAALCDQVAHAGDEALLVFAADKLAKARELRLDPIPADRLGRSRLAYYQRCLRMLRQRLPDSALVGELERELETHADRASKYAFAGAR